MSDLLGDLQAGVSGGHESHPVRIAVVGLGYWGPNVVRVLNELAEAEVVCVCDVRDDALARTRVRYPSIRTTTRLDEVLADPDVEAVAITTPVSTHRELSAAALGAGKHVFVEKPLATSTEDAVDMIRLAENRGLVLMPGHTFLYSPPVTTARERIQGGDLGEIFFVTMSRVNLGLHQPDISVVWDLAPHDFSILRYWLRQTPTRVSALSRSCIVDGTPDVAFINLEFARGTIAHIELSWLAPSKLRRTAVVGSQKMLVYDDTSNEPIRVFDAGASLPDPESFGEYRMSYRTGDIVSPKIDGTEPLANEMLDFCRSVRGGGEPRSSARLGADVVAMTEAVDRSLQEGGIPVPVESRAAATV